MTDKPPGIRTGTPRRTASGRATLASVSADVAAGDAPETTEEATEGIEAAKAGHPSSGASASNRKPRNGNREAPKHATLDDEDELYHGCFFGDPGKGKTTAAAAMARMGEGRVIFVNSELGLKAGPLRRLGIPVGRIEPRPTKAEREAGVSISYPYLEELCLEILDRIGQGEPITGVAWDTGNDIYQRCLQHITDKSVSKANTQAGQSVRDEWSSEIGDYGDASQAFRRLIRMYHSLPCHWAVTFHSIRTKDEEGSVLVVPMLSDKVLVDFLAYMDFIVYCKVEEINGEEDYVGFTRPVGKFFAKDRFKLLPRLFAQPAMDRAVAYMRGELVSADDPIQQAAKAKRAKPE